MRYRNRVRELREANGINSQRELARILTKEKRIPVSFGTINRLENQVPGVEKVSFQVVAGLAKLFNVSIEYLMGMTDERPNNIVADDPRRYNRPELPPEGKQIIKEMYQKLDNLYYGKSRNLSANLTNN